MVDHLQQGGSKVVNPYKRDYRVEVVDHSYLLERWQEITDILYRVFGDSNFNDSFTRTRPAEHTWEIIHDPNHVTTKHIIALDNRDEILGAFLTIPVYQTPGQEVCDLGWMFTIELHTRFRLDVMFALAEKVHDVTRAAGFKRIVTEMGTEAGAKFLSKKCGYIHTPTPEKDNLWTKELQ